MSSTAEDEKQFVFVFPPPTGVRVLLFAFAAFFLALALTFVFRILLNDELAPTVDYSVWALVLVLAAGIAFFVRLAFPSLASSAKLEIEPGRVRFTPIRMLRMIGEERVEELIPPHSTEILLCRIIHPGLSRESRIIVHGPAKEAGIKVDYLVILSPRNLQRLADGLTVATGLPVRMVIRRFASSGTVEETPWIVAQRAVWQRLLLLILATLPYSGGFITGLIRPPLAVMILTGVGLWLAFILGTFQVARVDHSESKLLKTQLFITVFTFAAGYAFSLVITLFALDSH